MSIDKQLVNRHVVAVALQFSAFSAPLESIAKFVAMSMGNDAPELPELQHYLSKQETQDVLAEKHEVGLWCGPGKLWRLVTLSTPQSMSAIEHRLNTFPDSVSTQCAWCLIDERNHYSSELVKIYSLHNEPLHRRMVHRQCQKPFMVMLQQHERAQKAVENAK